MKIYYVSIIRNYHYELTIFSVKNVYTSKFQISSFANISANLYVNCKSEILFSTTSVGFFNISPGGLEASHAKNINTNLTDYFSA